MADTTVNLKRAVILMCSPCARPLPHTFVLSRRAGEAGAFEEIYQCAKCHQQRRYGLVS